MAQVSERHQGALDVPVIVNKMQLHGDDLIDALAGPQVERRVNDDIVSGCGDAALQLADQLRLDELLHAVVQLQPDGALGGSGVLRRDRCHEAPEARAFHEAQREHVFGDHPQKGLSDVLLPGGLLAGAVARLTTGICGALVAFLKKHGW